MLVNTDLALLLSTDPRVSAWQPCVQHVQCKYDIAHAYVGLASDILCHSRNPSVGQMRLNPIQSDPCKLVSRTSVSESAGVGLSSVGITRSDCLAMNDSISADAQPQTM